jgi:hypothetical protein
MNDFKVEITLSILSRSVSMAVDRKIIKLTSSFLYLKAFTLSQNDDFVLCLRTTLKDLQREPLTVPLIVEETTYAYLSMIRHTPSCHVR